MSLSLELCLSFVHKFVVKQGQRGFSRIFTYFLHIFTISLTIYTILILYKSTTNLLLITAHLYTFITPIILFIYVH